MRYGQSGLYKQKDRRMLRFSTGVNVILRHWLLH